jgi:predicted anti-sigma-YlaC factor YlaD
MGGGNTAAAEEHFRKAMELNGGRSIGPLVSMAETVSVQQQDRERFENLLQEALAFEVDTYPETRLANLISQNHARWLLAEIDEFFFQDGGIPLEGIPIHGGMFRWPRR